MSQVMYTNEIGEVSAIEYVNHDRQPDPDNHYNDWSVTEVDWCPKHRSYECEEGCLDE